MTDDEKDFEEWYSDYIHHIYTDPRELKDAWLESRRTLREKEGKDDTSK